MHFNSSSNSFTMSIISQFLTLQQLSPDDDNRFYELLQRIGKDENAFYNPANGMTHEEYKNWLKEWDSWSRGDSLPEGFVPQVSYWLMYQGEPVGFGKVRQILTDASRAFGGNIGYAIDPNHRGKGFASEFLRLMLIKAREMKVQEILLTVEKYNYASKRVCEKNNGVLCGENELRWFFKF